MSLDDKSRENLSLANLYIKESKYRNAITSRVYYAIFQKMKFYLKKNNFDYKEFLNEFNSRRRKMSAGSSFKGNRPYSHGTIKFAIFDFVQKNYESYYEVLKPFQNFDFVYRLRKKADYEDVNIREDEIKSAFKYAQGIIETLEELK